jgi:hypothetical protein
MAREVNAEKTKNMFMYREPEWKAIINTVNKYFEIVVRFICLGMTAVSRNYSHGQINKSRLNLGNASKYLIQNLFSSLLSENLMIKM